MLLLRPNDEIGIYFILFVLYFWNPDGVLSYIFFFVWWLLRICSRFLLIDFAFIETICITISFADCFFFLFPNFDKIRKFRRFQFFFSSQIPFNSKFFFCRHLSLVNRFILISTMYCHLKWILNKITIDIIDLINSIRK